MMRTLVPLLLVGLAACYVPRSVPSQAASPYGAWQEPLAASLWIDPARGVASVDVNRPAHVAIFHLQPGHSVSMVYPAIGYGTAQHFQAGRFSLFTRSREYFPSARRASYDVGRSLVPTGPSYFVLIASERPLDVGPFYLRGSTLWTDRVSWSLNPYTATELLVDQIVADPHSSDWTVAYYVAWPELDRLHPLEALRLELQSQYRWVMCPGGVTIAVPLALLLSGQFHCPDSSAIQPPAEDTVPPEVRARIAEIVRDQGVPPEALGATEASRAQVEELARLIREARRTEGQTVTERALVRLPHEELGGAGGVVGSQFRPVIRPAAQATDPRTQPAATRGDARSRTAADAPRPHAEPPRPAVQRARPPPEPQRPAAERPRPQAERPAAPPVRRPATPPQRPQPTRPPPDQR
jgi:hypothetical protein